MTVVAKKGAKGRKLAFVGVSDYPKPNYNNFCRKEGNILRRMIKKCRSIDFEKMSMCKER